MRKCSKCKEFLPLENFSRTISNPSGYQAYCKKCQNAYSKANPKSKEEIERGNARRRDKRLDPTLKDLEYQKNREYRVNAHEKYLWSNAKRRAMIKNLDFDITPEDIIIPEICPILQIPLKHVYGQKLYSPSLDRIDPTKGYTKDNVWVISNKANTMKNNATLDELKLFCKNLIKYLNIEDE